ncbi:MAG: inner membrane protein YpjD [Verrucomicrobiales bacterium]
MALRPGGKRSVWLNMAVMGMGFALQIAFLVALGRERERCPITNAFDVVLFLSWAMVLLYFLLGPPFRVSLLGMFTAPMAFVFQLVALVFLRDLAAGQPTIPALLDPWFEAHAALSVIAYGAFALAFVAGIMYLVLDRQLKKRHLEELFYQLPPISLLGRSIFRLLVIGLVLLTVGILTAFLMRERPAPIHTAISAAVWLLYGVVVGLHRLKGRGFRRLAVHAIWAFAVPLFTLLLISHG